MFYKKKLCKIPVQWQGETLGFTGTGCSSSMYNFVLFLRAKSSNPTQPGVSRMTAYYSHQCVQEIGADIGPRQSCAYITWNCITRGCAQNLTIKNIFLFISVSSYLYSCSWGQNISTQSLVTCCPLLPPAAVSVFITFLKGSSVKNKNFWKERWNYCTITS